MIYADYNATTPCLAAVVDAVAEALREPANPSATLHAAGRAAAERLEHARNQVGGLLGLAPERVVFTSGATEACNLAIRGVAERLLRARPRFVLGATEHPAVTEPHRRLAEAGAEIVTVGVDGDGRLDLAALERAIDDRTALVSVMAANNETGVISPVPRAAELAHARGALLLCDATQAVGRLGGARPWSAADFVACSAHKLYGPPGVGALWMRPGLAIEPQLSGGGQERGMRSGTHNLPGIIGFGIAAEAALNEQDARAAHLEGLSARLETAARAALRSLVIQGGRAERIGGTSFLTCPGLARGWIAQLAGVAVSGGSSCSSGTGKASAVLLAMGASAADAANSVRVSFGVPSSAEQADGVAAALIAGARGLGAA